MSSLRSVVDRVGPTLLHAVVLPGDDRAVADVVIAEGGPHGHLAAGDLVLAVTSGALDATVDLVRQSAAHGAAAVLLKPPLSRRAAVRKAARETGIGLVEVHAKTSWAQLVWLLRTVLDALADESESSDDSAAGSADLFRLADAAASVVDAPVTIEDTNSRVLAYSARQDLTDPARVSTIMGRRIPDDVLARFRSRGVFRELSKGKQTIYVPAQQDGTLPRLIVPIRMGGELLGSMWAVVAGPVSDERAAAFADAAPVVAVHLLRRRAHADAHRAAAAELLRAVLAGNASPRRAIAELGLSDVPHRVVAVDTEAGKKRHQASAGAEGAGPEGLRLALLERISNRVGRHTHGCTLGGVLYLVVEEEQRGWHELRATLAKEAAGGKHSLRAAAGGPHPIGELNRSRTEADEALGLLRAELITGPVVGFEEVWPALTLHRVARAAAGSGAAELGPLDVLREHDRTKHADYVNTLYEWLRHPGDPRAAAKALRIHPNTLRYRMRKLLDVSGLDLSEPDVRLALLAQLMTMRWC
ncbi:MAG: PucR family transcriptional regulator [Actinophytocola sp.]|nr:PucR family transcriptional regulator [Actinophytocola sp.]